tara:strand:- start:2566 stop:3438 length:873 start_codon:yes stop_codon:yes gene_type:complete
MNVIVTKSICKQLHEDGVAAISQAIEPSKIIAIKNQVDNFFRTGEHLGPAINVAGLKPEHLMMYGEDRCRVEKEYENFYLSDNELSKGEDHYCNLTNARSVSQPLLHIEGLCEFVFNKELRKVADEYFGEKSKLGFSKVRKHFVNDLPVYDTNYFHVDDNGDRLLKCVIFLNEIDENGGPFTFANGSHLNILPKIGDGSPFSRTDEEVESYYGKDNIVEVPSHIGDVVFANTLGIHKGKKPVACSRNIFFINFVTEEEYGGKGQKLQIHRKDYDKLDAEDKEFGQYLKVV